MLGVRRQHHRPHVIEQSFKRADGTHPSAFLCQLFREKSFIVPTVKLTNAQIREFKARGQLLKPTLKVGKEGLSPQFLAALDEALKHNELLKVKFADLKEQKKELAPQLAEKTGSQLIMRVGNVALLYRPKPTAEEATAENV